MRKRFMMVVALVGLVAALGMELTPAHALEDAFTRTIVGATAFDPRESATPGWLSDCVVGLLGPKCNKASIARGQRCLYLQLGANSPGSQDATSGKLGYVLKLDMSVYGPNAIFDLKDPVTTRPGGVRFDFDVTFYKSLGTCVVVGNPAPGSDYCSPLVGQVTQPANCGENGGGTSPVYSRFGPEIGQSIPYYNQQFTYAIVTMASGANANFTFTVIY